MASFPFARAACALRNRAFAISLASFLPFAAFLLLPAAGCHRGPRLTAQQAEGRHLYEVRCAHCHRDNDLGLKKVPPDLHDVFGRAVLPSGAPATDSQVAHVVLQGKGLMPSFAGRFTDAQMAALLAYLHTGLR
jgi:mono/diheme cytochrome c family protein